MRNRATARASILFSWRPRVIKKFLILVNRNLYESKYYFARKFVEACERRGISVTVVDAAHRRDASLDTSGCDFTCSFNSILPLPNGSFFYDVMKIPHWSILLDPSFYYLGYLKSPYSIVSCVDRMDCEHIKTHGFHNVFFWPHAVERELGPGDAPERIYDVTLLGSCYDHDTLRRIWVGILPTRVSRAMDDAIELHASHHRTTITQAVSRALIQHDLAPDEVPLQKILFYVDSYVRGRDRVGLVKALTHARVHVFGSPCWREEQPVLGWSHSLRGVKNVTIHPGVPYTTALEIMKASKVSLNSMPFFKNGSHERIFASLACGALPVTSDNLWVRDHFADGKELLVYPALEWDKANELVHHALEHEEERSAIVRAGREKVMREHTWDRRVDLMLETLPAILRRISGGGGSHRRSASA